MLELGVTVETPCTPQPFSRPRRIALPLSLGKRLIASRMVCRRP